MAVSLGHYLAVGAILGIQAGGALGLEPLIDAVTTYYQTKKLQDENGA